MTGQLGGQITWLGLFWTLLALATLGLGAVSLAGFFGRYGHRFDICDHFRVQYIVLSIAICAAAGVGGERLLAIVAALLAGLNALVVWPIFKTPRGWKQGQPEMRLLLANVLRQNQAYDQMLALARASQADLMALVEADQAWLEAMAPIREQYPYQHAALRDDNYGLVLLSRRPLSECETLTLTEKGAPSLAAQVNMGEREVHLIVTHPPPPKRNSEMTARNEQMARLAEVVRARSGALILCGDFNTTPWSRPFREMEHAGGLLDSTRGFGLQATWPAEGRLLRVPIDHCLVSAELHVVSRKIGPKIGSDHLPLIIDFRFA